MSDSGNKEVIAQNIKHFMKLHGKTRKEMCEAIGVKYSTFSDWVNANKYPRIDKIEMMANYFGIEKSDLIEKHSNEPKKELTALSENDRKIQPYTNNGAIITDTKKPAINRLVSFILAGFPQLF